MTNAERVAAMAREITQIAEWQKTNLKKESHFCWESLVLYVILVLLPVGVYMLIK